MKIEPKYKTTISLVHIIKEFWFRIHHKGMIRFPYFPKILLNINEIIDIEGVQPMPQPQGMIFYLKYTYSKDKEKTI